MRRIFLDTSVVTLALGDAHALKADCEAVLEACHAGAVEPHASAELVQEVLHHRMRRTERAAAIEDTRDVAAMCVVHAIDGPVLERMFELVATTPIRGRDAVHAATALQAGFTEIISADSDFDNIPGLARIDPANFSVG